eukprot:evm.model.NODE_34241_length_1734_cov_23.886967.1
MGEEEKEKKRRRKRGCDSSSISCHFYSNAHTQKAYDPQTNDDEHEDAKGMAGDEEVSA